MAGTLLAAVRIAVGLMFLVKLAHTIHGRDVVWAHRRPFAHHAPWLFPLALAALTLAAVCVTLGLWTGPSALAMWALNLFLFYYASLYGAEDNVFQAMALYLALAGAGAAWSLDRALGLADWGRLPPGTVIPELALATHLGLLFFSAGITKLSSPMWRRGLGVYYFFLMPLHRRLGTAWLTRHEGLMRAMNYGVLALQLAALPAMLLNAVPLGLIAWAALTGFCVLLSTVFVFTWLGEILLVAMAVIGSVLISSGTMGLAERWLRDLATLSHPRDAGLAAGILITLVACAWTGLVNHQSPLLRHPVVRAVHVACRYLARYVWGFVPTELFTEAHLGGPVAYRVEAEWVDGRRAEVFRIFSPEAMAGPDRIWRPTFIEVTQYKIAEACMELDQSGRVEQPQRRQFLLQLSRHIGRQAASRFGAPPVAIVFKTLQLVPPADYAGASTWYLDQPWIDAFRVHGQDGHLTEIEPLARPILHAPTGRTLTRISFAFNPAAT